MKRSGIAGLQLADVAYGSGQTVDQKIVFGSPDWLDAVRHTASEPESLSQVLATVDGPWEVRFAAPSGALKQVKFDTLASWTASADTGIKYFSGTATYTKTVEANKTWLGAGKKILLDLGRVGDLAEVTVNGKPLALVWKAPFQVDVTDILKPGKNQLTIKVTNEWTNRVIGDKLAGPGKKVLDAYIVPFGGEYQLSQSGLMGPVKFVAVSK